MREAVLGLALAVSLSCAPPTEPPVRVFAASSLTDALVEAVEAFEADGRRSPVALSFGASSDLARQILAGAPADLFFSADEAQVDRVAAGGLVAERSDVLRNALVLVTPVDRHDVSGPDELALVSRLALADPEAVPAGVYARRYLESVGEWSRLEDRVIPTLDVRAALAAVASGHADAGMVYRTDAALDERVRVAFDVPLDEGPFIVYPLALLGAETPEKRALYDYLLSEAAASVFLRHGFIPIETSP